MPRKLKIVNIETKQEENNNNNEVVNEVIVDDVKTEIKKEELPATTTPNTEVKEEKKTEEKVVETEEQKPKTKVKVSNLIACEKCGRYMKENTLRFHHEKVCKVAKEQYVPKALKNTKIKAENIKHIVKEAIDLIEKERPKKIEKEPEPEKIIIKEKEVAPEGRLHGDPQGLPQEQIKPIIEEKQPIMPIRTSSQPPIRRLDTIQERIPTYADIRRERIEKKNNNIHNIFMKAF